MGVGTTGLLVYEGQLLRGHDPLSDYQLGQGETVYYWPTLVDQCGGILAASSGFGIGDPTRWSPLINTAHILRFLRNELLKTK